MRKLERKWKRQNLMCEMLDMAKKHCLLAIQRASNATNEGDINFAFFFKIIIHHPIIRNQKVNSNQSIQSFIVSEGNRRTEHPKAH